MISSCRGWCNRVFSHIGNVSSAAEVIEEIKQLFIAGLVEFRSRFSNFSRMALTNRSIISGCLKYFKLTCFLPILLLASHI